MGINYSKEVEAIRNSLKRNPNDLENLTELVCGLCLLAEENLKDLGPSWPNTALAEELIDKAKPLLSTKEGAEKLDAVIDRMAQTIYSHPRLKVRLLELQLEALQALGGHSEEIASVKGSLEFNKANIRYADSGKFKKIVNRGHLKTDPVEWTEKYEKVIDAAEKEAYAKLSGMPRGMGFCHAYWCAKSEALAKRGIDWRSPSLMNPGVLFD